MKKDGGREGQIKDLSIAGPELVHNAKGWDRFLKSQVYTYLSV